MLRYFVTSPIPEPVMMLTWNLDQWLNLTWEIRLPQKSWQCRVSKLWHLTKTENRNKKSFTQLSHFYFVTLAKLRGSLYHMVTVFILMYQVSGFYPGANTRFQFGWHKVVTRFWDRKITLIPAPTMVGGEENLWFLDALKHSILELTLPEKILK